MDALDKVRSERTMPSYSHIAVRGRCGRCKPFWIRDHHCHFALMATRWLGTLPLLDLKESLVFTF